MNDTELMNTLALADVFLHVKSKHIDFQGFIGEGFRRAAQKKGREPWAAYATFERDLSARRDEPSSPAFDEARIDLIEALLFNWYKLPVHLKGAIMNRVRDAPFCEKRTRCRP